MNKKLYVGHLSYQTTEATISELFEAVGKVVSVEIVTHHRTNNSLGFAFVEMAKKSAAKRAIKQLDGKIVDGLKIEVEEAHLQHCREPEIPLGLIKHKPAPWQR